MRSYYNTDHPEFKDAKVLRPSEEDEKEAERQHRQCQQNHNETAPFDFPLRLTVSGDHPDMTDTQELRQLSPVSCSAPVVDAFDIRIVAFHESERDFPRQEKCGRQKQRRQKNRHNQRQEKREPLSDQLSRGHRPQSGSG